MDSLCLAYIVAAFCIGWLLGLWIAEPRKRRYPKLSWSARARMRWPRWRA